jgi:hypothetical protein
MTLFRKVFQTQSRPAQPAERLDEDALRDAFKSMSEAPGPLVLDPFSKVAPADPDMAEADADDEGATGWSSDADAQADDVAQDADEADADEADADDEAFSEFEETDAEDTEDRADEENSDDYDDDEATVAGIAAALARTEAAEEMSVSEDEADMEEEDSDVVALSASAGEDGDAEAEYGSSDAMTEVDGGAEADAEVIKQDDSDVVAFAKQRMSVFGGREAAAPARPLESVDFSAAAAGQDAAGLAAGRAGRRAGRVKTRMLGFNRSEQDNSDPFGKAPDATATAQREKFPVGWLVVVEGYGIGHSFSIFTGASVIGRGEDQVIRLDFGDNSISRQNHAAIAYDEEQNKFYIGHGGKSNIIRRNARPVLSTEELHHADLIRIGETTLRFVALCGSDFKWDTTDAADASGV